MTQEALIGTGTRTSVHPTIRNIGPPDLFEALRKGLDDFNTKPSHILLLVVIYPLLALIAARVAAGYDMLPMVFPLLSGFALIGPVAAIGLYELSRERENGQEMSWEQAFKVIYSPSLRAIVLLSLVLGAIYFAWLGTALLIHYLIFGSVVPASIGDFVWQVLATPKGWALILIGCGVGFVFAVTVLAIAAFSFPMVLDRNVDARTAIETSVRAFRQNPVTMLIWGVIVAGSLLVRLNPAVRRACRGDAGARPRHLAPLPPDNWPVKAWGRVAGKPLSLLPESPSRMIEGVGVSYGPGLGAAFSCCRVRRLSLLECPGGGRRSPRTGAISTIPSASPSGSPASSSSPSCCSWPIASSASATAGQTGRLRAGEQEARVVADDRHRRSASRPCWRRACSSGTSSSPCPRARPRSRSSASNGSGATGCPARTASSARSDTRNVTAENPLGVNPNDPNGQDDVVIEGGEMHLPIGKPVKVLLRSVDVLHDFYVPEFRAKMDMVPGIGDLFLVHADPDRDIRRALRRTVRRRATRMMRGTRRGRRRSRLPDLARQSSRRSRRLAAPAGRRARR